MERRNYSRDTSDTKIYYGSIKCEMTTAKGEPCKHKAYFKLGGDTNKYVCGVHNRGKGGIQLPKDPRAKERKKEKNEDLIMLANKEAEYNRSKELKGKVGCCRLRMMKEVNYIEGYLTVFPNYKHGNRKDGLGLSELSPMSLGPIKHDQPGLPDAYNLENFWQGSKKYKDESMNEFRKRQKEMFLDREPHRHNEGKKGVIPECWVWTNEDGSINKLNYLESRKYYCRFYEKLARKTDQWKLLREKLNDGYNLLIAGYDGVDMKDIRKRDIEDMYRDGSRSYGHELVLCAMLLRVYPWDEK